MLYQPVDLPRPLRMQGVFVSDREVAAVTEYWRRQAPEPDYDDAVLAFAGDDDSGSAGQFSWLAKLADDEMAVRAAEVVTTAGRASTSMLQTKLKVGFNRASRLIDHPGAVRNCRAAGPAQPRQPSPGLRPRQLVSEPGRHRSRLIRTVFRPESRSRRRILARRGSSPVKAAEAGYPVTR